MLSSAEVTDESDEQIINCLEHVSFCEYYKISLLLLGLIIFSVDAGSCSVGGQGD
jgi:hypothetical protein